MMAKVINEFVDRHSGMLHEVGSIFECSEDRFVEISKAGNYVEEVKASAESVAKKENNKQPVHTGNKKGKR